MTVAARTHVWATNLTRRRCVYMLDTEVSYHAYQAAPAVLYTAYFWHENRAAVPGAAQPRSLGAIALNDDKNVRIL